MELRGKKVLLTGGVRGLGRAIVDALVAQEALITVLDLNEEGLAELRTAYPDIHCIPCNVADYEQVVAAVAEFHEKFKAADVLINNAGILYSEPLVKFSMAGVKKHDVEMWHKVLDTDLSSVFYVSSCVAEKMVYTRTKGVIVNISSVSAAGNLGQSAYSAAKAGVNALTATWAKELGPLGIRVVSVAPGFINTESTNEALTESTIQVIEKEVPLRRLGKAEEIAWGVLSAIENDYFNGKVFEIDGGFIVS